MFLSDMSLHNTEDIDAISEWHVTAPTRIINNDKDGHPLSDEDCLITSPAVLEHFLAANNSFSVQFLG